MALSLDHTIYGRMMGRLATITVEEKGRNKSCVDELRKEAKISVDP
jgi:hypothetical protein